MKKDKNGKRLTKQQIPVPKWPEPYNEPIEIAGFKLLNYIGYRRYGNDGKGAHWYLTQCIGCGEVYERYQGSLTRAVAKGTKGCNKCAKARFAEDKKASEVGKEWQLMQRFWLWSWAIFQMPVTSFSFRREAGKCFDSERTRT